MRRREFIAGFAGAVAWPYAARAQQPAMPVVGFMSARGTGGLGIFSGCLPSWPKGRGICRGLKEGGFVVA
jgi:hypothetical protein